MRDMISALFLGALLLTSTLSSCSKRTLEHYETPEWIQGNIWEILQDNSERTYSHFLKGVELTGFKPYLQGKGLLTVMAPDDEAFTKHLQQKGYASITEMHTQNPEELKKLIGFHLLYYSYSKNMMQNFRPEGQVGIGDDYNIMTQGMYYKFRTRSASAISEHYDPINQRNVSVYHLERFIPVFSRSFFERKKITPKSNYEFFYPGSTWTGQDGFNVSNASINNYAIVANNGYVYTTDRVIEPLETIYQEMKQDPNFSTFLELYDNYTLYEYDPSLSIDYGPSVGKDSLYLHKHSNSLPPIALEWPTSNYRSLSLLASVSYSVFAPSNKALQDYFGSYWLNSGYTRIQDLDPLILSSFLNEYVYGGSVAFPEEITSGKIVNAFGTAYNFDPQAATVRKMCVNGALYGFDEINGPQAFGTVAGPVYQNKKYLKFLYAIQASGQLPALGSSLKYTLLIPEEQAFLLDGYSLESSALGNYLAEDTPDGKVAVSGAVLMNLVNAHTVLGDVGFQTSGTQVVPTLMPYNYLYIKNGAVTSSNNFKQRIAPEGRDPFVAFEQLTNHGAQWSNGKAYTYNGAQGLFTSIVDTDGLKKTLANNNDNRFPYYVFSQLLRRAGLVSVDNITGITGRFIAFIPTNEVLHEALASNRIPGITNGSVSSSGVWTGTVDQAVLRNYLFRYFVSAAQITTCPYPGSEMQSGDYFTFAGTYLTYTDLGTSLRVKQAGSSTVSPVVADYDFFPFTYNDGSFHLIGSIL